ncbi:MAG: hypothetical protein J6X49_00775 [Victivallales bacterium]|nr:hypothetical protein [Victivallales bacterium]
MAVRLLIYAIRHRRQLWIAVALLLCASILAAVFAGRYTNDLSYMFPEASTSGNMYHVMQSSRLTQSIQLELDTGVYHGALPLLPKLEELAEAIRKLPNVASVDYRFTLESPDVISSIITSLPLISDASILDSASPKDAVMSIRKALALPGTPIADHRADPFGLRLPYLRNLETFRNLGGFNASMQYPFLTDMDAQRVLMLINADFRQAPSSRDIAALFKNIDNLVNQHLPDVTATIVSPLKHNLENERAVKRDILTVSLVSIIALIALVTAWFFFTERQSSQSFDFLGIIVIPLMPVIASIIVTGILALCFHSLCLFVLGICGGIAGLAVDQGIHIYTAYAGRMRIRRLAGIHLPLALSVITSAASFLVLLTTGIVAYRQMGLFAALTLILNLFLSFTLLPTILKPRRPVTIHIADFRPSKPLAAVICIIWLAITVAAVIVIPKLQFNLSLQSMDGSSAETFRQEEELQKRWRSQDAGNMMVVTADCHDDVLDACDDIMNNHLGNNGFSPSSLWPSMTARQRHLDTWTTPQTTQRLQNLQLEIRSECQKAKLPPAFFDGFFKSINQTIATGLKTPPPPLIQMIHKHLIRDYPDSTTAIMFLPKFVDNHLQIFVDKILPILPKNAALLSSDVFRLAVAIDTGPRFTKTVIIIIPLLIFCLLCAFRSPMQILLILLPGSTAILWGLGLAAACGFKLNLVNLFSIVMLTGLVIDYGIFALHHARQPSSSIPTAMLLSALTTILTTGALLASKHPVMFSTGLVLSFGILLTATTALFVIPSLVQILPFLKHKSFCLILPLILLLSSGCASLQTEKFPPRDLSEAERTLEINDFQKLLNESQKNLYKMTIHVFWYDIPMLLAVKTDAATGSLRAVATATNGVTLFSVSGKNFQEEKKFISDVFPDIAKRRLFNTLFDDLCHVFLPFAPDRLSSCPPPFGEKPNETFYADSPLRLVLLKNGTFPRRRWQTAYYGWFPEKRTFNSIVYKNFQSHYRFTFTLAN